MDPTQFDTQPQVKSKRLNVLPPNPETAPASKAVKLGRFPSWLHRKLPAGRTLAATGDIIHSHRLHTVCEEASCPNLLECWSKGTATFLTLGKECTRSCGFCDVKYSKEVTPLDPGEAERIADSVEQLGLKHVVLTMVARDDLPDGGAEHLVRIVAVLRKRIKKITIELLTSDFLGNIQAWDTVLEACPEIFNYNIETVRELTPKVRHTATYERTLQFLKYATTHKKHPQMLVKSGLMLGLGETEEQIYQTLQDLHDAGCNIITLGQYLQPNRHKLRVQSFITPDQFKQYELYGKALGVPYMYCGPFVRSSYNADRVIQQYTSTLIE